MKLDWGLQFIGFSRPLSQLTRIIVLLDLLRRADNLLSRLWNCNSSEEKRDGSLISADQIRIRIVVTSIDMLSGITGRR